MLTPWNFIVYDARDAEMVSSNSQVSVNAVFRNVTLTTLDDITLPAAPASVAK